MTDLMVSDDRAWRLDAFDARAGRAFVAYREEGFGGDCDEPAMFIEPPKFRPVRVGSRAPGMAATRHSFQQGLFAGKQEVSFSSLDAVTEFVRRCYVAGRGGGDGEGEGRVSPLPRSPAEPNDERPKWTELLGKPSDSHEALVRTFLERAKGTSRGSTTEMTWTSEGETAEGGAALADHLGRGCAAVATELLRRYPGSTNKDEIERSHWIGRCWKLGTSSEQLGVLRIAGQHTQQNAEALLGKVEQDLQKIPDAQSLRDVLFEAEFAPQTQIWPEQSPDFSDPVDVLDELPVPEPLWKLFPVKQPAQLSLFDLLSQYIATPQPSIGVDAWGTVLFAASLLTHTGPVFRFSDWPMADPRIAATEGRRWLYDQLPRQIFDKHVENLILSVACGQ